MNVITQSPDKVRVALFGGLINLHQHWRRLVNTIVPEPYLDEVFHIPQAQAYWAGRWGHWDNKITTPPALYGFSYLFTLIRRFGDSDDPIGAEDLRFVNVILLYFFLVTLYIWTGIVGKSPNPQNVLQAEINIIMFPLFFFFSGLYYTDLFSALTVILTYIAWSTSVQWQSRRWFYQILHVVCGLVSLASRQTNIFWVGIFLGGLQVVQTVKRNTNTQKLHDPEIGQASISDIPRTCISLLRSVIPILPRLILDIWPSLTLLISFTFFVIWNNGVVLGDKSNHIATIHTPQMLYIWPFIFFFSWPTLLPHLANPKVLLKRLPSRTTSIIIMALMALPVHFNTIIHPFTLADNRHYIFYVFRILTRKWWIKYAAVPIYYTCGWLVLMALGLPNSPPPPPNTTSNTNFSTTSISKSQSKSKPITPSSTSSPPPLPSFTNPLSFTLIFLVSTTLSLITAPLVEPRYFLIPWLIWRLHVPEASTTSTSTSSPTTPSDPPLLVKTIHTLASYNLWLELLWYLLINYITIHIFLYRGFGWIQEPGRVQRFMW